MNNFERPDKNSPESTPEHENLEIGLNELADKIESIDPADIENSKNPKIREKIESIKNSTEWKMLLEIGGWAAGSMAFIQGGVNHPEVFHDPEKLLYALGTGTAVVALTRAFKQFGKWSNSLTKK